jgi:multisubunit Na+/H+ antiporter MnhC subunit
MDISLWAIVTSIVIGVASNLLTPYAAKYLGNVSKSIKKRNEQKKISFENTVKYLMDNPNEELMLYIRYSSLSSFALIIMVISMFMMFSNNAIQVLFGFVFFLIANFGNMRTNKFGKMVTEIRKRKKKIHPGIEVF